MKWTYLIKSTVMFFCTNILISACTEKDTVEPRVRKEAPSETISYDTKVDSFNRYVMGMYKDARLGEAGLDYEVFRKAMLGYYNMRKKGLLSEKPTLTVFDISKSSKQERMFVIDLEERKLVSKTLVAHGKHSGADLAQEFSNTHESNKSSIGFYVASETYQGKHGKSLRLDGLDTGYNTNARSRGVVVHGADYVSKDFANRQGRLGRSQGCPALPQSNYKQIIEEITGKTCFFIYYPDKKYEEQCDYLNEQEAVNEFVNKGAV